MPRPYSQDLRERIVGAVEAGASRRAAAQQFGISVSCVVKLVKRSWRTGSVAPGQIGSWRDHALAEHNELVEEFEAQRRRKATILAERHADIYHIA